MDNLWEFFLQDYSKKTSLPIKVLELIAVLPLVKLCAVGNSNKSIAKRYRVTVEYVEDVLINSLNFSGWEDNLEFSPLAIYKEYPEFNAYKAMVLSRSQVKEAVVVMSFNICVKYTKLKEITMKHGY